MKKTIAVLSGGGSAEREISLASGKEVSEALKKLGKYEIRNYDPKTDLLKLMEDKDKIDIALPVLHGPDGEDGTLQGFLELLNIPYGFSGVLPSAIGVNKDIQKMIFERLGILVPKHWVVGEKDRLENRDFPCVVKPNSQGSSVGVSICRNEGEFLKGLEKAFKYDQKVIIEDFIDGTEITVGVLGRGKNAEALPVVEIVPKKDFFDYEAKYDGTTEEIIPARIPEDIAEEAQALALKIHRSLDCSGITRTDMIINAKGVVSPRTHSEEKIYVLEINTIPGMTRESLIPKEAKAAGIEFENLIDRLVELAGGNSGKKA